MRIQLNSRNFFRTTVLAAAMILVGFFGNAQNVRNNATFEISVKGTSNLHDWSMKATGGTMEANFNLGTNMNSLAGISKLVFNLPVNNLKSGESLMDSRAYKTLNADKYKNITFVLTASQLSPLQGNQVAIKADGFLTISGVSKQVSLTATGQLNADKSITLKGSKKIKMSEYKIEAPSFMLGALRTGDDLTIDYSVKFK
jgi:polyisoprenoid-binding protein YceI